ncbi:MAG: TonB family protein [Planctomycetes bacterium]|nr:TonB family protein [Planctomycetota bacterium]
MDRSTPRSGFAKVWRLSVATGGAMLMMLACFLLLPVLQAISATVPKDLELREVDTAALPPPPPPIEEEKQEEKPPEDAKPPEMVESAPPLDLAQLELALNPGTGGGDLAGDYAIKIQGLAAAGGGKEGDDLFSLADLDQKPRVLFQQQPVLTAQLRKRMPATVNVVFTVDEQGRVDGPRVQTSSDAEFEAAALAAIRQWKFEPGKRAGKPVRFRMRQPMTFK